MGTILRILLIVVLDVYFPIRYKKLINPKKNWPGLLVLVLLNMGILPVFVITRMIVKYDHPLISIYYLITTTLALFVFFFAFFMILFELINFFYTLPPRRSIFIILITTFIINSYALINASFFKIIHLSIPANISKEVKIAQISDVHLGVSRDDDYLEKIIQKTNTWQPDIVVITGDIADSKVALTKNMFTSLQNIEAPAYYVYGNHDVYVGLDRILQELKDNRVTVLQNETVAINDIKLTGLNYMKADNSIYDPHQVSSDTIKDIIPTLNLNKNDFNLIIQHGPWGMEYITEYGGDVVLTGHTHGGQVFPFTLVSKNRFPYNKGLSKYLDSFIYVSQGVGTFFPRMRLGTNNELTFITLTPEV